MASDSASARSPTGGSVTSCSRTKVTALRRNAGTLSIVARPLHFPKTTGSAYPWRARTRLPGSSASDPPRRSAGVAAMRALRQVTLPRRAGNRAHLLEDARDVGHRPVFDDAPVANAVDRDA